MTPEAAVAAIRLSEYQNYGTLTFCIEFIQIIWSYIDKNSVAADAVITISLTDKTSILKYDTERQLKANKLFVVPFVASPWEVPAIIFYSCVVFTLKMFIDFNLQTQDRNSIPSFETRTGLIFVGNMVIYLLL